MKAGNIFIATCAMIIFSASVAQAGPCSTASKDKDAGSGPTVGHTDQTTGAASTRAAEHPPTSAMNKATGTGAASSQDAQQQMQGKPTAAQQAQGSTVADDGC